ncbi:alpha-glucosidase [Siphonobacter sp. BAB-5385]|uniref:glycoside hydrolase family 97 protein n=1 Tax=Siphonobacter sp. BAB-5385 TaxID=1864822 RepID=UPI000B9E54BA|nr:glycoside hydrolase family 97 protein [Siphonobacter sp. BAB-5385]OZI07049.1 alpha-glucosidase [Siphonobacter sp. BAB-5385]
MNTFRYTFLVFLVAMAVSVHAQRLYSPNKKIELSLSQSTEKPGNWFLSVYYHGATKTPVFSQIKLGLETQDQSFTDQLSLKKSSKPVPIHEQYTTLHGKRLERANEAQEITFTFTNAKGSTLNVVARAYNNGIAFKYEFPEKSEGTWVMKREATAFVVEEKAERWLQAFVTSYEGFYPAQKETIQTGEWGYPALFKTGDQNPCWTLLTEANVDRNYCATKLSNRQNKSSYQLEYPAATDGNNTGPVNPTLTLPWSSPWRVAIIGQLADIVESTLVEDVSKPSQLTKTDWIKPGVSSWVYWAYNHGTKDYKKLCEYVDLAARMGWPYTLMDWEWDEMTNGGTLEDAVAYAKSKGVKPLLWYNSGGAHNQVSSGPRDRLTTPESRAKEFAWLKKIGIYGVKVDFFESDKQEMMRYYLDILEDAVRYELMVNFHGSTVPRGWSRTYPHLMSMEAVYGGEQYNNQEYMTSKGAWHNTLLPFTRNVIGPMDYTPVAFTNSQHSHTTTYAHELALAVVFESGIQHLADRPAGFDQLPDPAKFMLSELPTAWDETRFLAGYPGKEVVIARRKAARWYVAGINGEDRSKNVSIPFHVLEKGKTYRAELMADADYDSGFNVKYLTIKAGDTLDVKCLPRGGFTLMMQEL